MEVRERTREGSVIVELLGRVDEFNTRILSDEVNTILNSGRFYVVLELSSCHFLSAHCLSALWGCRRRAQELGGEMCLCGAFGEVLETIQYVGFDKVFPRTVDVSEALAHIKRCREDPDHGLFRAAHSTPLWKRLIPWCLLLLPLAWGVPSQKAVAQAPQPPEREDPTSRLTLSEVLRIARESSPAIRMARLKMIEREAEVRMARSVVLPKLIATGGYLYQSNPSILSDAINREINNVRTEGGEQTVDAVHTRTKVTLDKDIMILGAGFTQLVYAGGVFQAQIQLKEAQRREAEAVIAIEGLTMEEQVRNLFLGLELVREKIHLLNVQKESLQGRLNAAQKAREARLLNAVQLTEAEVALLKCQQELLSSQRDERNLRGLLNIGLGRPTDSPFTPIRTTGKPQIELQSPDHYFEIALHRYPELRRASALMDSASSYQNLVTAQGTWNPQIFVFGSTQYTQGLGIPTREFSWSAGFGFLMPLYDGNKSTAERDKSESLAQQSRIAYEEAERKLHIDINEVVTRIEQSLLQYDLAEKSVEIARLRLREAENAVSQGQIPVWKLGEVQAAETEARITVIAAESEIYKWHARLMLLTGQMEGNL